MLVTFLCQYPQEAGYMTMLSVYYFADCKMIKNVYVPKSFMYQTHER